MPEAARTGNQPGIQKLRLAKGATLRSTEWEQRPRVRTIMSTISGLLLVSSLALGVQLTQPIQEDAINRRPKRSFGQCALCYFELEAGLPQFCVSRLL